MEKLIVQVPEGMVQDFLFNVKAESPVLFTDGKGFYPAAMISVIINEDETDAFVRWVKETYSGAEVFERIMV